MDKWALDEIDRELLALLGRNARRPLTLLARAIGLSRSATQERLQRLESSGVIERYTVIVRRPNSGFVDVWLRIGLAPGVKCSAVAPAMVSLPAVRLCHALAGEIDLLVLIRARNTDEASDCRDAIAALTGVRAVESHLVLAAHAERFTQDLSA